MTKIKKIVLVLMLGMIAILCCIGGGLWWMYSITGCRWL